MSDETRVPIFDPNGVGGAPQEAVFRNAQPPSFNSGNLPPLPPVGGYKARPAIDEMHEAMRARGIPTSQDAPVESRPMFVAAAPQAQATQAPQAQPQPALQIVPPSDVSGAAINAVSPGDVKRFKLSVPIDVGGGVVYSILEIRRPKWAAFERLYKSPLYTSGNASEGSVMMAAVTGLPLDAISDMDGFDAMRLLREVTGFLEPESTASPRSA